MSVQDPSGRYTVSIQSIPILVLTLALIINFFWRAQLFTGNNLPPVVLLAVAFIGLWILRGLGVTGDLLVRIPRVFWPLGLYVAAVLVSILVRGDFESRTIQLALRVTVLLLLTLLVSNLAGSLESLESTMYLLIIGFTLAALYGFADYVINGRYFLNIFVGIARKNASGYYFMAIIPFILFCMRSPAISRTAKRLLILALILCFGAMLLTLARSAVVGLAAGLAAVFVLYSRRVNWGVVVGLVLLVTLSLALAPDSVTRRLGTTLNFEQQAATSNSSRIILLRAGLRMAQDHPLVGVGVGRFDDNLLLYTTPRERQLLGFDVYEASHNQFVAALNDGGVVAFMAILWLLAEVLLGLHRRLRRPDVPKRYLLLAFAAFWWAQTAHFFVEWQLARELFWFLVGLTSAVLYLTDVRKTDGAQSSSFIMQRRSLTMPGPSA
ncbi:MAG: O-antigen ligase family protein [Chloroflexota bacterium]|nr:O-antigen ligase family protein [Chloroflexota bacterium]